MAVEVYESGTPEENVPAPRRGRPDLPGEADEEVIGDPEPGRGPLLDLPPRKAAELAARLYFGQDEHLSRKIAQWQVNRLRQRGVPGVGIRRDPDTGRWRAYVPPVVTPDTIPSVRKAWVLCQKLTNILLADPPAADPVPATGDDDAAEAAAFSARVLADLDSEAELNEPMKWRRAINRSHIYDSGFIHYFIDPRAGGYQPIEVMAGRDPVTGELAEHIRDAELRPVMEPVVDPATGQPVLGPDGQPLMQPVIGPDGEPVRREWPDYVFRYVRPDGTLTDDPAEAARRWMPGLRSEVLTGRNVRFIPHNCQDIWEADGIQIHTWMTWGEVKRRWPKFADLERTPRGRERIAELLSFEPDHYQDLMSPEERRSYESFRDQSTGDRLADEKLRDEQLVFVLTTYYRAGGEYPRGCQCITLGETEVAERGEWIGQGPDGAEFELEIPVTQFRGLDNGEDDPYGTGLMTELGPGDELRLAIWGFWLDYLDAVRHRKVFLPSGSNLTEQDLLSPLKRVLRTLPNLHPTYEQIPEPPNLAAEMYALVASEMENASHLEQTAQGTEAPSVQSGRHALAILNQVHAQLSEYRENVERAITRGWRIKLQLVRAAYSTPRQVRWTGQDGEFRQKRWTAADLGNTQEVRIKAGTLSMMAPAMKAQLAEYLYQLRAIEEEDFRDAMRSNLGGTLGIQDSPYRLRVRRQIEKWLEGPPKGWKPQPPPPPQIDPNTGQLVQPPPPPDPVVLAVFDRVASDDYPPALQIRITELGRFMQEKRFMNKPPEWRAVLEQEYLRLQQIAQQQAAAAAAASGAGAPAAAGAEPPEPPPTPAGTVAGQPPTP